MHSKKKSFLTSILSFSKMDITGRFAITVLVVMTLTLLTSAKIIDVQLSSELKGLMSISDGTVKKLFAENTSEAKRLQAAKIENLSKLLAALAPAAIAEFDLSTLTTYAKMVRHDEDIGFVAFETKDGKTLGSSGDKTKIADGNFVKLKIENDGVDFGQVVIGFNYDRLDKYLAAAAVQSKLGRKTMVAAGEHALSSSTISLLVSMAVSGLITVAVLYWMFIVLVTRRLGILESSLKDIAEGDGDLTKRVAVNSNDAIDRVGQYFNAFLSKIHNAISRVDDASQQLAASSSQLAIITDETKVSIDDQQSETEQVATAINEMAATVSEVARNATDAATATHDADEQALAGRKIVTMSIDYIHILVEDIEEAAKVISQLKSDSQSIGSVLDVIQGIAEQTNLLALNAAIEAARAGEQGRGFAVVADEVRTLASRTQESTTEIKSIIDNLQAGAEKAVHAMDKGRDQVQKSVEKTTEAGASLESITAAVAKINEMNTQIASAAEEQNSVAEEINQNITRISQHAEKTASGAQTTQMASTELASLSEELNVLMSQFKIK